MLSLTNDPLYAEGLEAVRQAWQKLGVEVTVVWVGGKCPEDMKVGDSWQSSIEGVPDGNLAKLMRVIDAEMYAEDWCLIADADMLPMDLDYFIKGSNMADSLTITMYTKELTGVDRGKHPACYMLAKGETFARYVNPLGLSIANLVMGWDFDRMGNPQVQPFSDESVYARLFEGAPKTKLGRYHQDRRLCRSGWPTPEELDRNLASGAYIDCHMPRPYNANLDKLEPVLKAIGVGL